MHCIYFIKSPRRNEGKNKRCHYKAQNINLSEIHNVSMSRVKQNAVLKTALILNTEIQKEEECSRTKPITRIHCGSQEAGVNPCWPQTRGGVTLSTYLSTNTHTHAYPHAHTRLNAHFLRRLRMFSMSLMILRDYYRCILTCCITVWSEPCAGPDRKFPQEVINLKITGLTSCLTSWDWLPVLTTHTWDPGASWPVFIV